MLRFSCFEFDMEHQVLYKEQVPVSLNPRQAQILALFLSSPHKIFSKDDILDQVWEGRVVSEQVVFQNISHIRSLLGAGAIKTFPKKGYQWQLPLDHEAHVQDVAPTDPETSGSHELSELTQMMQPQLEDPASEVSDQSQPTRSRQFKSLHFNKLLALFFLLVVFFAGIYSLPDNETEHAKQGPAAAEGAIKVIPFVTPYSSDAQQPLTEINRVLSGHFDFVESDADGQPKATDFFNSPYIYRKSAGLSEQQLLMSGYVYLQTVAEQQPRQLLLEYLIQGERRNWHGYIQAVDTVMLVEKLQQQLQRLAQSQYFTLPAQAFTTAELSMLHSQSQGDMDSVKHLIEAHLEGQQYQVASALIDLLLSLSQEQNHRVYEAYAHWLKGQLLLHLEQYTLAEKELQTASEQMKRARFLPLQSEISKSLADVMIPRKDFQLIRRYLYQAASEARLAERPVLEIRAYTLLSIRAAKLGYQEEKYDYLYRAKKLISDYGLDASHNMLVFYHFALFADTDPEQEAFFKQVLEQPVTPENYWVFFSASQFLAEIYCNRQQWQLALELADNVQEEARKAFLKAKIYRANNDVDNTRVQARLSFNSARTQHIDWIGLDMALVLLELRAQETQLQADNADALMYRRYIQDNHSDGWAKRNRVRLQAAGIELNPYGQNKDL